MDWQAARWAGSIAGLLFALASGATGAASAPSQPAPGLPGALVNVGGPRMYLDCRGRPGAARGTTVVFDAGLGDSALVWSRVQPIVANSVRACSYDRAGYGESDARPPPRTSREIVHELHWLLEAADIEPPYLLVGHSFGGWNMQLYASTWPEEIDGLVLVDSSQVDQIERYARETGTTIAPKGEFHMNMTPYIPPGLPPEAARRARELSYDPLTWRTAYSELVAFRTSERQVAESRPLPGVPMVVVSRGARIDTRDSGHADREHLWRTLQQEFVDGHPGTVHFVAHDSGHYIQLEQPELVIQAICLTLGRAGEPTDGCDRSGTRPPRLGAAD
ncbi:alpha/beta hydrolase [Salinisphaera sp. T31B1]|uniref:alpha/beta fold hydrolase n=1 Tax=Salinisphaera sp. T31B1 TaxID=727963 RepID=UPI00333FB773